MTNQIAIALVVLIAGIFLIDATLFTGQLPLFLAKQFVSLVEYLSFWR